MILNTELFNLKLKALREFQQKYPTSHVGGSIGLFLRGIDLQRDLSKSDLDITIDEYDPNIIIDDNFEESSCNSDFDAQLKYSNKIDNQYYYSKIEIRVCPEPSFETIEYKGHSYNVSKLRDILFWKKKYSKKGVLKHRDDLITIETGIRPTYEDFISIDDDELPF